MKIKRAFFTPTSSYTSVKRICVNPAFSKPCLQRFSNSIYFNDTVGSLIATLLQTCGPTTVIGIVAAFIIKSFKRMFRRRPTSHISDKIFVGMPAFANNNSSPSIMFVAWMIFIFASSQHRVPRSIFTRSFTVNQIAMFNSRLAINTSGFDAPTTTGFGHTVSKVRTVYTFFCPAIATAFPKSLPSFYTFKFNNLYTIEPFFKHINFHTITMHEFINEYKCVKS